VQPAAPPEPCATAPQASAESSDAPVQATGVDGVKDRLLGFFNDKNASGVFGLFDPRMQEVLPLEKTRALVEGVIAGKGRLLSGVRVASEADASATKAAYEVTAERGKLRLELHLDPQGRIDGMKLSEPLPPDPAVERSTIPLRIPFRGKWTVMWGGDRIEVNQHVNHKSQRRAADLVIVGDDGKTHTGDGKKVSDYHAWGKEVLAVADGEVTTVVDGIPENEPGRMNAYLATGNLVVLSHGPKLFSTYAHLQPAKIRVRVGQKVRAGTVLGLVGNTGNSSEPHLHFQLQDGPDIAASFGIEALFDGVRLTRGKEQKEATGYSFLKGDIVEPAHIGR